jgi:hypothetical protein
VRAGGCFCHQYADDVENRPLARYQIHRNLRVDCLAAVSAARAAAVSQLIRAARSL